MRVGFGLRLGLGGCCAIAGTAKNRGRAGSNKQAGDTHANPLGTDTRSHSKRGISAELKILSFNINSIKPSLAPPPVLHRNFAGICSNCAAPCRSTTGEDDLWSVSGVGKPSSEIDLGGEQVLMERLETVEALSTPFHMTLDIISRLGELDLLPHLGKPACVGVSQDDEFQRYFHGLATEAEFTKQSDAGFHYRIVLRPWTYFLSHNRDFAIYQDKDALEIIKGVLEEAGISDVDYTRLRKSWPKRTYCVQYAESDFAFISRLMEEEGIYYHFTHSEDRHVLVLCDGPSSHSDGRPATLTYNPSTVGIFNVDWAARTEGVRKYYAQSWIERVSTGGEAKVTARDFDFEKPERPLEAVSEYNQAHPHDSVEVYGYPFRYKEESDGKKLGTVVLDALRTDRQSYRGQSQATGLSCGAKVTIEEHLIPQLDGEYVIQQTFHSIAAERFRTGDFSEDQGYNVIVEAVRANTQWRAANHAPPRRARPRKRDHHRPRR